MKRTPLTRKTRLKRSPLPSGSGRPSTLKRSRKPLKQTRHRKAFRHLRDEPYKRWVRSLGCRLAGMTGHVCRGRVEFSHIVNEGNGGPDFANGLPLCGIEGHRLGFRSWHVMGRDSWQRWWRIDAMAEAFDLGRQYRSTHPGADQ